MNKKILSIALALILMLAVFTGCVAGESDINKDKNNGDLHDEIETPVVPTSEPTAEPITTKAPTGGGGGSGGGGSGGSSGGGTAPELPEITITMSLEAFTIGLGYIIEPMSVTLPKGKTHTAKEALFQFFKANGVTPEGNDDNDYSTYYMSSISSDNINKSGCKIPQLLLDEGVVDLGSDPLKNSLGQGDYSIGSGWMYSVDNNFPSKGFADYQLNDGDVMRIQFTTALGCDLVGRGFVEGDGRFFGNAGDKTALTKLVGKINSENNITIKNSNEYITAIAVLQELNTSVESVETTYNNLKTQYEKK